jgi:hypothetical protein
VLVLVADPLLELLGVGGSILDRGMAFCAALALVGFERHQRLPVRVVITAMAAVVLLTVILGHQLSRYGTFIWIPLGVLVVVATVREALRPGSVDRERIFAALSAYLFAGMLFGAGYWQLSQHDPASFGGTKEIKARIDAVFFSYGTLATLGYGDVVPVSSGAHGLAVVEAMGGQIYLAVLLARLVSLYAPANKSES